MFRNLIPMLADKYQVVAPDFPGYGESSAPLVDDFDYSFERLASVTEKFTKKLNLSSYALYLSDIGASKVRPLTKADLGCVRRKEQTFSSNA
jgi:pimeloyl-ACP methyl ester carboxylesterase